MSRNTIHDSFSPMRWLSAAVCLIFASAAPALAAEQSSRVLTVQEAVAIALERHPELRAAAREVEAAGARQIQAAAVPNPNLTLLVDQVPLSNPANGNYMAGVSQPLLLGGQRETRMEAARLELELASVDREVLVRDLVAQVKETYARHLFDHEELREAELNLTAAQAFLDATRARFKAGELAKVEVLRAEVEHSRARRTVELAESRELQSRASLNILLGQDAHADFEVQEAPVKPAGALPAPATLVEQGIRTRPELRRAELVIQREALQRRLVQTGIWTGTEATLYGGAVAGQPAFSTSLTLPIPLYRQQGEVAEAEANRARAEARRDALRNQITLEVELTYRDAAIASRQAEAFRTTYMPQAERLADNARRRFLVGEGSGLEVAEARRALQQVRTEYLQALLEHRQAIARLERAVGADLSL